MYSPRHRRAYRGAGQDLFFHINHPIKWVRVAGFVIAIDEFAGWKVYTVDDSSGVTIECHVQIPKTSADSITLDSAKAGGLGPTTDQAAPQQRWLGIADGEIEIGHIIDVKGSIRVFRDVKRIKAEKIVHLHSTEQEVQFWEKVAKLRSEVLSSPWLLERSVIRKCLKRAGGHYNDPVRKHKRKTSTAEEAHETTSRIAREESDDTNANTKVRRTCLERTTPGVFVKPKAGEEDAPSRDDVLVARPLGERTRPGEVAPKLKSRVTGLERATSGLSMKPKGSETGSERRVLANVITNPEARATGLEKTVPEKVMLKPQLREPGVKDVVPETTTLAKPRARETGLERRAKQVKRAPNVVGKYDALGL